MTWKLSGLINDVEFAYLLEALKVEGYWSLKSREVSIQNKDMGLLKYLESLLVLYGLRVTKRYLVKVKPEQQNFVPSEVLVKYDNCRIPVRIEYSLFDSSKKIVFNLPFSQQLECTVSINDCIWPLEVVCNPILEARCEQQSFVYLELRSHALQFLRMLESRSGGRGAHNIRLTPTLWSAPSEVVAAAFSALIDCEGSVDYYKFTRRLRVRMVNRAYLQDWKVLLAKHSIESHLGKSGHLYCLTINGLEKFHKLDKLGLVMRHSVKSNKWKRALDSYVRKQLSRGRATIFYSNKLKELGKPVSASELATIAGKSKRVVGHYLTKLSRSGLIQADTTKKEYLYYCLK